MILEITIDNSQITNWKEQGIYINKSGTLNLIDISAEAKDFNTRLQQCEDNIEEYLAMRESFINNRISERKKNRNIYWYLKRIKPRYAKLILDMWKNRELYKGNVCKYFE